MMIIMDLSMCTIYLLYPCEYINVIVVVADFNVLSNCNQTIDSKEVRKTAKIVIFCDSLFKVASYS